MHKKHSFFRYSWALLLFFPTLLFVLLCSYGMSPILGTFNAHFHFTNDHFNFVLPKLAAARLAWEAWQFPLWNILEGSGIALFAAGSKPVFTSPLSAILPGPIFIPVVATLHVGLALILFYIFARKAKLSEQAAVVGAVIWVFCGYHTQYANDHALLGSAMWFPLFLTSYLHYAQGGNKALCLVLGAISIAAQAFGGRPTGTTYNLIFAGIFIIYHRIDNITGLRKRIASVLPPAVLFSIATILGLGLACVFLLPFISLLTNSSRFIPEYLYSPSRYAPFTALAGIVLPEPFPSSIFHLGLAAIPCIAVAWFHRQQQRPILFYFKAMAVALLFTVPLGFFDVLRLLPAHAGADVPVRVLPIFFFCAAMLTATGFDILFFRKQSILSPAKARWTLLLAPVLVGLVLVGTYAFRYLQSHQELPLIQASIIAINIAACLLVWISYHGRRPGWAGVSLAVGLFLGLFLCNQIMESDPLLGKYNRLSQDASLEASVFLVDQAQTRQFRTCALPGALTTRTGLARLGLQSPAAYEAARPVRINTMLKAMTDGRRNWGIFNINNVEYFLGKKGHIPSWAQDLPVAFSGQDDSVVLRNPQVIPRAFLVNDFMIVDDPDKQFKLLGHSEFDAKSTVLLEQAPDIELSGAGTETEARIDRYTPNEVTIKTQSQGPGLLVLLDTYDPGWHATVDGSPAPLYRADFDFRAVPVPGGSHVVTMRYQPRTIRLGLGVSACCAMILCVLGIIGLRQAKAKSNGN